MECACVRSRNAEASVQDVTELPVPRRPPRPHGKQPPPSERQDGLDDDFHGLLNLVLLHHERRGQPDDVAVGWLGQKPVVSKPQAHLPGIVV